MNWLKTFNPQINWEKGTLEFNKPGLIWTEDLQVQEISQMATMSHSQHLDQEHEKKADIPPKTIEQLVPRYLLPYKEVFLQGKQSRKTLPKSQPFDHEIKLKEGFILQNCKIYPLNPKETERMKEFIKDNLANGFIKPLKSPQASPFFFVGKKEAGEFRPCQDYHYLNEWTIKNSYPLPLVPELLDSIGD
jgi:hypothetical protein